jgi:hypothetical protein
MPAALRGVHLGACDYRMLVWLTTYEPSTCAVIAGLITRAHGGVLTEAQGVTVLNALDVAVGGQSQIDHDTVISPCPHSCPFWQRSG